jgi:hypothetical protein
LRAADKIDNRQTAETEMDTRGFVMPVALGVGSAMNDRSGHSLQDPLVARPGESC